MPAKNIKRELLTNLLLDRLVASLETGGNDEVKVGDHEAPTGGGWPDEEGVGTFVNYVVLTSMPGGQGVGSLRNPDEMMTLPYALTSIAINRRGVENTADRARAAVVGLINELTSDNLKVHYVSPTGFGAVERIDSTEPPFYAISDTVSVMVSQD